VTGLFLERLRDLIGGIGEVRRDRDVGLRSLCRRQCAEGQRHAGQDMQHVPKQQLHRVPSLDHASVGRQTDHDPVGSPCRNASLGPS
jgi:hypothetical protein